jgi:hypothetical protein
MKKYLVIIGAVLFGITSNAFAHETQEFEIGGVKYQFVVGSINEPITVDDATGVELRVTALGGQTHEEADEHEVHVVGGPQAGIEQALKVELIAGDKKKQLELRPAFGQKGLYTAKFYPTVETTYTYRFFGTLNNTPVDLSFTCNPAGHPQTPEDTSSVEISDEVTRTLKKGAFGCPAAKAGLGFPEQSASINELTKTSAGLATRVDDLSVTSRNFTIASIVVALLALAVAVVPLVKGRRTVG